MGIVTSPAESPRLGSIGLAILDAAVAEDGTKLEVGDREARRSRRCRSWTRRSRSRAPERARTSEGRPGRPGTILSAVSAPIYGVVPNFSEGRRVDVMDAICEALQVPGAHLVYRQADPDHNRLDTTVLGDRDARRSRRRSRAPAWPPR